MAEGYPWATLLTRDPQIHLRRRACLHVHPFSARSQHGGKLRARKIRQGHAGDRGVLSRRDVRDGESSAPIGKGRIAESPARSRILSALRFHLTTLPKRFR